MSDQRIEELVQRGDAVGSELAEIGKQLFQLGEVHEARHALAALLAGDTTNCTEDCPLHFGNPKLTIERPGPERTPEMIASGQVWAHMRYPDGSEGWEVRGTGVKLDHDPLCSRYGHPPIGTCALCDLIRKARADEAAKHHRPNDCCVVCGIHANPHRGGGCMLR